ncbi:MAG: type I secretion system permease/ATPase [Magnetococcales bacterium]|nr:type I secretion system permease/ATPase [Magnetococcales bacterium]
MHNPESPETPSAPVSPQWATPPEASAWDDPLLQCLAFLTRHWHRPRSEEALRADLPLVDNRLTPELFVRAAARAGLAARVVRKRLARISPLLLPAVLLLKDRQACLLVAWEDNGRTARLVLPETGEGESPMALANLEKQYTGHALFVRPEFQFDARSQESPTTSPTSWFWGTLGRFWPIYGEVIIASLLINLFTLASPLFVMNVYDRVVPNNALETLWVLALGAATVFVFDFVMRSLRGYFLDMAGKKADVLMASQLFQHVTGLRAAAHPASTGALAKNLQEFEALRDFFTSATLTVVLDLPFLFLFLWVVGLLGGDLVWIPLLTVPLVILVGLLIQFPLNRVVRKTFKESSQKHAILVESLSGLEDLQILGAGGVAQRKWEQCVGLTARSSLTSRFLSSLAVNFATLALGLTSVAVVIHGVYLIAAGELTMGALVACTILSGRALAPLAQVAGLVVRLQQSLVSLKALNRIMALPVERPHGRQFLHRPCLAGGLAFDKVTFQYPGQSIPALHEVTLTIQPGERVGFIGRIGSGKSTLLKLVLGLYQPQEGAVLADGVDLRQIDPADLRRNMGCVPQDPVLFFGTVRDNIALGAPFADDAEVLRAAALAGVDDFIRRHPRGYDMPVGEQGKGLSGGQRQAIAIARALVGQPAILLLDEPTSSMDSGSEDRFKAHLTRLAASRTLLLVTHKASLLTLVDRLVVLDEGRVAADGPRERVLKLLAEGRLRRPES